MFFICVTASYYDIAKVRIENKLWLKSKGRDVVYVTPPSFRIQVKTRKTEETLKSQMKNKEDKGKPILFLATSPFSSFKSRPDFKKSTHGDLQHHSDT